MYSHLRPCNTNASHDPGEEKWLIVPSLDIFTHVLTFAGTDIGLDINNPQNAKRIKKNRCTVPLKYNKDCYDKCRERGSSLAGLASPI